VMATCLFPKRKSRVGAIFQVASSFVFAFRLVHSRSGIRVRISLDTLNIEGSWISLFVRVGDCGMDFAYPGLARTRVGVGMSSVVFGFNDLFLWSQTSYDVVYAVQVAGVQSVIRC
jgi:hypothetical protein